MDTTRDIIYRGFPFNDSTVPDNVDEGTITGSVLDSFDLSDVDVVQYQEKLSQRDGMDAGDVFLGARRVRASGTLYGVSRGALFDLLFDARAAMSPVLAQRESPDDHGYRPLTFYRPTTDTDNWPLGYIPLQVNAMPRAFSAPIQRDGQGGVDTDPIALPYQCTWVCIDPSIMAQSPQDANLTVTAEVTGATGQNTGDTITKTAHGLSNGDRVTFYTLTGGSGLSLAVDYYVVNKATNTFQVSLANGGSAVAVTGDYSSISYVKGSITTGNVLNRLAYLCPLEMLVVVGKEAGSITGSIGDSNFVITIPASSGNRTIRIKPDNIVTFEEDGVETTEMGAIAFTNSTSWPLIGTGTSAYTFTVLGTPVLTGSHFWFYEREA